MSAEKSEASSYLFYSSEYIYIYCHDGFIYLAQKDISTSVSVLKT